MTWVRIDEGALDHPKLVGLDDAAFALWARGLCYANRHLTDGRIPYAALPLLSRARKPALVAEALVVAGLWERAESGYQIHDFADYQPTKAELEAQREERAASGRKGAATRWQNDSKSHRGSHAVARHTSIAKPWPGSGSGSDPDPDPDPSGGRPAPPAPAPVPEKAGKSEGEPRRPAKLRAAPSTNGAETPAQVAWRTWRAEYHRAYHRAYPPSGADGPTMTRLAKLAAELLADLERPPADLEALLVHRWRRYLADPGSARQPGAKGFLAEHAHPLQHLERGLAAYGTPWDRAQRADVAAPRIAPPSGRQSPGRPTYEADPDGALPALPVGKLFG